MKNKYFIILIVLLFALFIIRFATVQTNNIGTNKLRDIVPKRITSILRRLTKNQCNQILHHQKIIKRSWTNAPLPLLRFLVYQLFYFVCCLFQFC